MPKFIFPQSTGRYTVGTKLFELTDPARNDPETGKPRELVVQVWYPAEGNPGDATASYAYEARQWYKQAFAAQGVDAEKTQLIDGIRTHAIPDASACDKHAPYPIVIFGHGNGAPRGAYSYFCEEIASHGYIVVMVMHTNVTFLTRFSDGREIYAKPGTKICTVIEECFADIEFMLNQAVAEAFGKLTALCDFNNIGMVGHSLGGITTAQVCRRIARVKAGVSLDAPLLGINATEPFHKPFMFIRTSNFYEDNSGVLAWQEESPDVMGVTQDNFYGSIERFCHDNGKDTLQIVVEGANHMTFMDSPILYDFFARIFKSSIDVNLMNKTTILPVPEIVKVISMCITTFLNRHLKGEGTKFPSEVRHNIDREDFDFYIPNKHPKHVKIDIDPKVLDQYVGQYKLGDIILTITRDGNKLLAGFAGQPPYAIYPESETRFFYTVADIQISFVKDVKGHVTKLIMHQNVMDQEAEKIK